MVVVKLFFLAEVVLPLGKLILDLAEVILSIVVGSCVFVVVFVLILFFLIVIKFASALMLSV